MVRATLAFALVLLTSTMLTSTVASAQDARALFEQGRQHASAERWVEALEAFTRSRELVERPPTVFNIAAVLVRLGRAREALVTLDRYLEISDPRRDAAMRSDAVALRRSAEASLRHVTLRVRPGDARVEIDGQLVPGEGAERSLVLDPGPHAVAVALEGYATARFTLETGIDARDVVLEALDGTLVVESTVSEATIALDGEPVGVGRVERSVRPGAHLVELAAAGYLDFRREIEVAPGARVAIDAALEALPRSESLVESPVFWGLLGGGVAVVTAVVVAVAVASAGVEAPYGGNTGIVLAPLTGGF
jgi:tetratricopeptide (TPR) repeat protein